MKAMTWLGCAALAVSLAGLAVMTMVAVVASRYPFDCPSLRGLSHCPLPQTAISAYVESRLSYFQAIHAFLIKAVPMACLVICQTPLTASVWASLEPVRLGVPLGRLDASLQLARNPSLPTVGSLLWQSRFRLARVAVLALILASIQLVSDFAVGPIYDPHRQGPWSTKASFGTGGVMGIIPPPQSSPATPIAFHIQAGRVLLTSATYDGRTWSPMSTSGLPFLSDADVASIWWFDLPMVPVLHSSIDCGPGAVPNETLDIGSSVWSPPHGNTMAPASASIHGHELGRIFDGSNLAWLAYSDAGPTVAGPGWFNASSTNMFVATNATIEGAQQRLTSPNATGSRIGSIDVLYCRSEVMLRLSSCSVRRGDGENTIECWPAPLPSNESATANGGLDMFFPGCTPQIATALSTAPYTAMSQVYHLLPVFSLSWLSSPQVFPLPFTTLADGPSEPVTVPLRYVTETLFPLAQHGLVQGLLGPGRDGNATLPVDLVASFATSRPWLSTVYLCLAVVLSSLVLLAAFSTSGVRRAGEFGLMTTLEVSTGESVQRAFRDGTVGDGVKVVCSSGPKRELRIVGGGEEVLPLVQADQWRGRDLLYDDEEEETKP